jgi:hypothetical protein
LTSRFDHALALLVIALLASIPLAIVSSAKSVASAQDNDATAGARSALISNEQHDLVEAE